jgi:hypothetical protein
MANDPPAEKEELLRPCVTVSSQTGKRGSCNASAADQLEGPRTRLLLPSLLLLPGWCRSVLLLLLEQEHRHVPKGNQVGACLRWLSHVCRPLAAAWETEFAVVLAAVAVQSNRERVTGIKAGSECVFLHMHNAQVSHFTGCL